jgi:hypothetical protein
MGCSALGPVIYPIKVDPEDDCTELSRPEGIMSRILARCLTYVNADAKLGFGYYSLAGDCLPAKTAAYAISVDTNKSTQKHPFNHIQMTMCYSVVYGELCKIKND